MIWLRTRGALLRQFYSDPVVAPYLDPQAAQHRLLIDAGTLRSSTSGETANLSASLANGAGQCSRLFADDPPLSADLLDEGELIFTGAVSRASLDATCGLDVQAPLSEPITLRQTTVWGNFADAQPIPHRYGATSGRLLQYDQSGLMWVWADHAVGSIDSVTVNGRPAGEWQWRNSIDNTGHAIALVQFGQPQDTSAEIIATGRAKIHPVRGGVMENPATVIWDILANVQGWADATEGRLDVFRQQCATAALVVGGSIESADSPQTIVRAICDSVGAVFAADCPGLCRLWPGPLEPSRETIDSRFGVNAIWDASGIVNDLTMQYDYLDGQPRQSLQMQAKEMITAFGRKAGTIEAKWLTSPATAYGVAMRVLQQRARPQWVVTASNIRKPLNAADTVTLDHPMLPIGGDYLLQSRSLDTATGLSTVTFNVPIGDIPAHYLTGQSSRFPSNPPPLGIMSIGSDRILTLRDPDTLLALVGAAVTIDNRTTRTTNTGGQCTFPADVLTPGRHRLDIATRDGRSLGMLIAVDSGGNFVQTIYLNAPPPQVPAYYDPHS